MNGLLPLGRNRWIAAAIAFLACLQGDAAATILRVMDYETPGTTYACATEVSSPTRGGKRALKLALPASPTKEINTRCEHTTGGGSVGQEYWYGSSFFFPSDWPAIVAYPTTDVSGYTICQFINYQGNGCFPFLYQIQVNGGNGNENFASFWRSGTSSKRVDKIAPVRKGQWNDIVIHAKWSLSNTVMEVYIHGNKVWQYSGPMGNSCNGPTPKLQYRVSLYNQHHMGPARYLIHDEYRMGDKNSNYQEVMPGRGGVTPILTPLTPMTRYDALGSKTTRTVLANGRLQTVQDHRGLSLMSRRLFVLPKQPEGQ